MADKPLPADAVRFNIPPGGKYDPEEKSSVGTYIFLAALGFGVFRLFQNLKPKKR